PRRGQANTLGLALSDHANVGVELATKIMWHATAPALNRQAAYHAGLRDCWRNSLAGVARESREPRSSSSHRRARRAGLEIPEGDAPNTIPWLRARVSTKGK